MSRYSLPAWREAAALLSLTLQSSPVRALPVALDEAVGCSREPAPPTRYFGESAILRLSTACAQDLLRMIDYRELDALAKDPQRASRTAAMLLTLQDADWNEWETDFLENLSTWKSPLSTRQAEKLIELRDAGVLFDKIDGFSLKALIDKLWIYRHELADSDFIGQLKAGGTVKLRKRQALKLLAYARQIGEIEPHQGWRG
jgi:hypothetical protein